MTIAALAFPVLALMACGNQQLTGIHAAARDGNVTQVRALLDQDPGLVNAAERLGWTPLHFAAQGGHEAVAKLLLARGADVNARLMVTGGLPLHVAATTGHAPVVALLLANGARANTIDGNEWTPLHRAAISGNREVAELLLAKGANAYAWSNTGVTPIDQANASRQVEFAALLRERVPATLPMTDNFADDCRWTSGENPTFSFGCEHAAYRLHLKKAGPVHVTQNFDWKTRAVSAEIDVTVESSPGAAAAGKALVGIGCLARPDSGYVGVLGTDGGWAIMRIAGGFTQLAGPNTPRAITGLRATNRLRVVCARGNRGATVVTFFVNDTEVGWVADESGSAPFNGVALYTDTFPGVVRFEHFAARKLLD